MILVAYMKLTIYVVCEVVNLMYTAQSANSIFVIMCYMTFMVIGDIDAMYYFTIKSALKEQLEKKCFVLPITNLERENKLQDVCWWARFQLAWITVIEFLYETVYFHLFPMLIYLFIFWVYEQGNSKMDIEFWKDNMPKPKG